jgi:hypothetical protein
MVAMVMLLSGCHGDDPATKKVLNGTQQVSGGLGTTMSPLTATGGLRGDGQTAPPPPSQPPPNTTPHIIQPQSKPQSKPPPKIAPQATSEPPKVAPSEPPKVVPSEPPKVTTNAPVVVDAVETTVAAVVVVPVATTSSAVDAPETTTSKKSEEGESDPTTTPRVLLVVQPPTTPSEALLPLPDVISDGDDIDAVRTSPVKGPNDPDMLQDAVYLNENENFTRTCTIKNGKSGEAPTLEFKDDEGMMINSIPPRVNVDITKDQVKGVTRGVFSLQPATTAQLLHPNQGPLL